jgi:type II secretory pathway pseudopilin PulG
MRLNDFGLLAIVLLAGLLVGIVGTLAVYSSVASRQGEAEQKEAQETIRSLQEERDQLQAQINDYVAAERDRNQAGEQPVAVEDVPQHSDIAAAPRRDNGSPSRREGVPPPREDKSTAKAKPRSSERAPGYGPPREYGNKTDR